MNISGESAHEVITESIDFVLENGDHREVWGGTIPEDLDDDEEPNDYKQEMIEYTNGFSYVLENPRKRWSEYSNHWPGITLRETEDDLQSLNPGYIPYYSKVYRESWLESRKGGGGEFFPHTYGRRMQMFGDDPLDHHDGNHEPVNQWDAVRRMLEKNPSTRKAVMSFWDPHVDTERMHDDMNAYVPCNITFQLRVVDGELNWHTFSRSKDLLRGSTENLFEFPLLQELMAMELGVDVGKYVEYVSNVHIYQEQIDEGYLDQDVHDPYDYYDPESIGTHYWEVEDEMKEIDELLESGNWEKAYYEVFELPDYWRSWKAALAAEWVRLNSGSENRYEEFHYENEYRKFYELVEEPWAISLTKRAAGEYGDQDWLFDNVPSKKTV